MGRLSCGLTILLGGYFYNASRTEGEDVLDRGQNGSDEFGRVCFLSEKGCRPGEILRCRRARTYEDIFFQHRRARDVSRRFLGTVVQHPRRGGHAPSNRRSRSGRPDTGTSRWSDGRRWRRWASGELVGEQDPVQVVDLVLEHGCARRLLLERQGDAVTI